MARTTPSKKTTSPKKKAKHTPNFLEGEFSLPKLEEKVLAFWESDDVFQKSLVNNKAKQFVFYEGPPYANGKPAIHHVLARVVKDVILRYKTMQGYYVPRRAGWDTHGLPVEMAAEKELGFRSKKDIEAYGVKKFNEKAKEQVWLHKDEWERMTRRIGYWLDLKNAYVTYSPEYIETIWWTMARIAQRDLLYKGHKVVPWCTRCGTALSSHELAQGYKDTTDNSVYVKFKLKPDQKIGGFTSDDKTFILSWTTTPWTLPGNVALAVGEKISYAALRVKGEKEIYILASALIETVFPDHQTDVVRADIKGKDLIGVGYEPLFDVKPLVSPLSYKIYPADFVTTTDGTGVVHTAVMYGEDDYALGKKIGLPEHHTVDEEGKFKKDVPELVGRYAKSKETEEKIFEYLRKNGNLLRTQTYVHEYPYCWRCGTAILYYARTSWFIAMSKLRSELLKNNATVNWMPEHVKTGRFGEWLREVKDWNLSRERYWGAPLPIWECKKCVHTEVVESLDAFNALATPAKNHYWAMRHGEAENNVLHVIDSGAMNLHLTAKGKKQAAASVKKLKTAFVKNHKKIDLIFSSDLLRTKETSAIAAEAFGAKVIFDARLREVQFGSRYDGQPSAKYLETLPTYEDRFEKHSEKTESFREVRTRVWNFIKECEEKYSGKNILIISHGEPIWMLLQAANGVSEKKTIEQKRGEETIYPETGEIKEVSIRTVPRNDTGEVDLHRPFVDEVVLECPKCKKEMKRVREVADVWYDSGAMPFAQAHYPFDEAKTNVNTLSGLAFPADYIAEGMDQTRGWFYTLMAISTALGYEAPYKNVVALGLINDKFGQKMSKSKGNVVEPFAVIDQYGVDALRWYFYTGSPLGEPKNFDEAEVAKAFRRTHLIVYNSFIFWKTYADQKAIFKNDTKNILDAWILARLNEVIDSVSKKLDAYEIREAAIEIEAFVDDLSRWYIRRSRRRLQRPESAADYAVASATLGYALRSLVTMMAPFTPFFSEGLYSALHGVKESVHLDAWPKVNKKAVDKKIVVSMKLAREFAAAGLAERAKAGIKVRQPLASMKIGAAVGKEFEKIVADEVNVKKIIVDVALKSVPGGIVLDTVISAELRDEGSLRDIIRMFQELRQKAELSPKDKIIAMLVLPAGVKNVIANNEVLFKSEIGAKLIEYGEPKKFIAEQSAKIEGQEVRVAIRKA
jgi:isoleucyl-tRNA synthetase